MSNISEELKRELLHERLVELLTPAYKRSGLDVSVMDTDIVYIESIINSQVLEAIEKIKSRQSDMWSGVASDGNEYRIPAVPLSAIEAIEKEYK